VPNISAEYPIAPSPIAPADSRISAVSFGLHCISVSISQISDEFVTVRRQSVVWFEGVPLEFVWQRIQQLPDESTRLGQGIRRMRKRERERLKERERGRRKSGERQKKKKETYTKGLLESDRFLFHSRQLLCSQIQLLFQRFVFATDSLKRKNREQNERK
jgi:hypothetical protein